MESKELTLAHQLIDFIDNSPSSFHAVSSASAQLEQAGFKKLDLTHQWQLTKGGKYYTTRNQSALFAFVVGSGEPEEEGVRMICAHSDSPSFKIKPSPEMVVGESYLKLNTEVYGGPILMSWLDRPLSLAGRVSIKGKNILHPENRLINFKRPLVIIPNLAIHLNRSVNEGIELNKQKEMLPIAGILTDTLQKDNYLIRLVAAELGIDASMILDFDLFVNEHTPGCLMGLNQELISSPRLDDLAMVHAGLKALIDSEKSKATQMLCIFDNEEVGSQTKQGAGSPLLRHLFERIIHHLGKDTEALQRTIYRSFMISADMAHALHPNWPEKHDPVLQPLINQGPVIKIHANQKYTSDGESSAVFESLCQLAQVPFQKFVNRSDMAGGSTLGNIATGQLDIRSVDVGNPMLAMHSARELAGVKDHLYMTQVFQTFYQVR